MTRGLYALVTALAVLAPSSPAARAEAEAETPAVKLVVHPAAEPRPALKYQFLPGVLDRRPGNAAVLYGKVTAEMPLHLSPGNDEFWETVSNWMDAPLEELRTEEVRKAWKFGYVIDRIDKAARCDYCDWQLPIREEKFYTIVLPEVQQLRAFARLLAAQARIQIAEGRYDEAVRTLQTGYALGRHAAEGQTLVNGLVGIAVCRMMSKQVEELIQQPGAPNLYWALTMLPRPLIDVRQSIDVEMNVLYLSYPELRDVENATETGDYWRHYLQRFWRDLTEPGADSNITARPEVLAAMSLRGYPIAKRWLIEQGYPREKIEAMPVAQVVAIYTVRIYNELRDDWFKWFYVPYLEGREGHARAEERLERHVEEQREIIPVARMLLPAISSVNRAVVRNDRSIAALRAIEALRIYGSGHQGRLPEKLGDVTSVSIPLDPVTGEPFHYELRGDTALLEGPPLPNAPLRYEIKLVRP
jgi:hypothetical protein